VLANLPLQISLLGRHQVRHTTVGLRKTMQARYVHHNAGRNSVVPSSFAKHGESHVRGINMYIYEVIVGAGMIWTLPLQSRFSC
jgi:hypothetical protein